MRAGAASAPAVLSPHRSARPGPAARGAKCCSCAGTALPAPGTGGQIRGSTGQTPRQGSARAALGKQLTGTFGDPHKACSCLSYSLLPFVVVVGGFRPNPVPTGGSTLFSLSPPEPFHLSLTSPGPSCGGARPPFPLTLLPVWSGFGALPQRCGHPRARPAPSEGFAPHPPGSGLQQHEGLSLSLLYGVSKAFREEVVSASVSIKDGPLYHHPLENGIPKPSLTLKSFFFFLQVNCIFIALHCFAILKISLL